MRTQLKRVQSAKGQGPVSWQTPAQSTYTVQCPCQLHSLPDVDLHLFRKRTALCSRSRPSQFRISSLWRERDREKGGGGGGVKGSAHFALQILVYVRPGNGSISHSGSRPDNGSKISKFGIFALLTSSCWWYSKVDLLYILGSMFVTLLDDNCMFATHNSLMICMNCWASFERRERSRFSEACIGPG